MKNIFYIFLLFSSLSFGQGAIEYYNKGIDKLVLKDYYGAIEEFNKSITFNPNFASAYINRGFAKQRLNDLMELLMIIQKQYS